MADLVVRTPRLELRWPSEDDLVALAELAAPGIHDDDEMPFAFPWTRAPAGQLELDVLRHHWKQQAEWTPERWSSDIELVGLAACLPHFGAGPDGTES